ncbi:MAG: cytochrome c3 family protein [Candidatus Methylomirabilia bacterium]
MRRTSRGFLIILVAAGALVLAAVGGAWAQGILDTKHNLSTNAGTGANRAAGAQEIYLTAGTSEVCVFCHTPHGADTSVTAPLWNRAAITTTGYQLYTSPTLDATTSGPTGVSAACLSCHDGTIAFDALRNLPGSGGFDANAPSANWTWAGGITNMSGRGITLLGTDLRDDHPVSMVYSDAKSPSSASGTNDHATGFTAAANGYVSGELPLYSGLVQCGTCHDPHRANTKTFLRKANDNSDLCLTCHKKNV